MREPGRDEGGEGGKTRAVGEIGHRGGDHMAKRKRLIEVTITCTDCGTKKLFTGEDVTLFLKAMDLAGWHSSPEAENHSQMALCPECYRKPKQEPK